MLITVNIFWSLNGLCTLQLYCFCIYISFEHLSVYSMLYCLTVEYANLREMIWFLWLLKCLIKLCLKPNNIVILMHSFFFFKQPSSRKIMFNVQLKWAFRDSKWNAPDWWSQSPDLSSKEDDGSTSLNVKHKSV